MYVWVYGWGRGVCECGGGAAGRGDAQADGALLRPLLQLQRRHRRFFFSSISLFFLFLSAKRKLDGMKLDGKVLHAEWALPREGFFFFFSFILYYYNFLRKGKRKRKKKRINSIKIFK
jgi:hypothetical protein